MSNLQSAFHINNLLEIHECMQNPGDPTADKDEAAAAQQGASDKEGTTSQPTTCADSSRKTSCFIHDKELELYCETCGKLICNKCALFGVHHDHNYSHLNGAFERYREEITSSLEPLGEQIKTLKKALACIV